LAIFKDKPVKKGIIQPFVSLVIPAYNEEMVIEQKIKNALSLDYPKEKLEIIVVSDGSTDATADIIRKYISEGIKLFDFPLRRGKPAVLNEVIPQAKGEIIVFSDASSIFKKDALEKLVRNFCDSQVGCVCGDYKFGYTDSSLRGKGESLFVKYELFLKRKEAQVGSVLGLHGAIYAIRKELYTVLKINTINDDYIIPAKIVENGFRSVFEAEAIAYEIQKVNVEKEFRRRIRISIGNWQQLTQLKSLLNPLRGMIFIEFMSHKVLRSSTPVLLFILFFSNTLIHEMTYRLIFLGQVLFYLIAIMGYLLEQKKVYFKLFYAPFYFCMSNLAVAIGFLKFLSGKQEVKWQR
jgi:cellulose synthase/poly-beta-1,6-N-acetylglucosamine synthase-like glycosyltransferase